jgi:ubiquinone/menaquinone biosynthesis C-methylase UbiE
MKPFNFNVPDLIELYSRHYDDKMLRWRSLGASDKANNIESMVKSLCGQIKSVLEVGCGSGAVLQELADRRVGWDFKGIEISDERSKSTLERNNAQDITILGYDGKKIPFEDDSFDLVYATHVLEHVTDLRGFLLELRRVARRFIYVEVPCELHLRTSYRALQTTLAIGHINSYTFRSFALTLETSGLRIIRLEVFDHKYEVYRFQSAWWKASAKLALRRSLLALNRKLASHLFTYHAGALCEKSTPLNLR